MIDNHTKIPDSQTTQPEQMIKKYTIHPLWLRTPFYQTHSRFCRIIRREKSKPEKRARQWHSKECHRGKQRQRERGRQKCVQVNGLSHIKPIFINVKLSINHHCHNNYRKFGVIAAHWKRRENWALETLIWMRHTNTEASAHTFEIGEKNYVHTKELRNRNTWSFFVFFCP